MNSLPADLPRHTRTLRRDLEALEAVGFPLVTETVDGRTRWRLMDGFRRIPALSFSATEIMALVLGRDLLKPLEGTQLKAAVDSGGLYLIAYCHVRRDVRMFAVERIRSLTVTTHAFQLPLGFDVEAYVEDALVIMRGRLVEVELLLDRATAAWARDRLWHPSQQLVSTRQGLQMTLRVADTRELMGWILSFGRGARVIRPAPLRERVRQEASALARY